MPSLGKFAAILLTVVAIGFGADPALLNLVMPDARTIFGLRVDRIRATPFGRSLLSEMQSSDAQLQALISATGFDPRRDLNEVMIASPGGSEKPPVIVLARGSFDRARFTALAKSFGGGVAAYEGVEILAGSKDSGAVALLNDSTLLAGDLQAVQSAIARRGEAAGIDDRLTSKLQELSSRFDVWGVSLGPISSLSDKLPNSDALKSVEEFSGGMKFGTTLQISAEVRSRTEKDANSLADVLRFFAGMMQSSKTGAAKTGSLDVTVQARTVKFSLVVPQEQLTKTIQASRQKPRTYDTPVEPPPANTDIIIRSSPKDMGVVVLPSPGNHR